MKWNEILDRIEWLVSPDDSDDFRKTLLKFLLVKRVLRNQSLASSELDWALRYLRSSYSVGSCDQQLKLLFAMVAGRVTFIKELYKPKLDTRNV